MPEPAPHAALHSHLGLLEGGSLELNPAQRRQRRRGLYWSLGLQLALGLVMLAGLQTGPPLAWPPAQINVTYLVATPPLHYFAPPAAPRVAARRLPAPAPHPVRKRFVPPPPVERRTPPLLQRAITAVTVPSPPHLAQPPAAVQPPADSDPPAPIRPPAPPPAPKVELGRFGDPRGIAPAAAAAAPIPQLGRFGAAAAGGDPGADGPGASVHDAGFGDAAAATPAGAVGGTVRASGFGAADAVGPAPVAGTPVKVGQFAASASAPLTAKPPAALPPAFTPPQVLSWPTPAYTAEAAAHKVEGEVALQVKLAANGGVEVLHVLHSLGYGLDASAIAAARQVRFVPARRNGQPVDWTVVLHIRFQLAY